MNAKYKKSLKIVTLLITSIIVATVSADTYSELFINSGSITIGSPNVYFTNGDNTTSLGSINGAGTIVTFNTIPQIAPGDIVTYDEAVNITNAAGASKTITVDFYSLTGYFDTNFDYVNLTMIAGDGSTKGTSVQTVSSGSNVTSTGGQAMANGEVWALKWIIKAKADATIGQSFTIAYKVTVA